MIPLKKLTTEAYQADPEDGITHFGASEVDFMSVAAGASPRQRCRILCHPDKDSKLHSMLVAYKRQTYLRPNRHYGKDESVLLVKGNCYVAFFDDFGRVTRAFGLDEYDSRGPGAKVLPYFVRIPRGVWHMLFFLSDTVLMESTPGPFDPGDTEYAPWSPAEGDAEVEQFRRRAWDFSVWRLEEKLPPPSLFYVGPQSLATTEYIVPLTHESDGVLWHLSGGGERARICAHTTVDDRLQEMLIAFPNKDHVRPSRHAEDETLYVLSGTGTYCFFDDHGSMTKQVPLGPLGSGKSCFCRVPAGRWHTMLLDGPMLVLEACPGPYRKENTEYAPWEAKK